MRLLSLLLMVLPVAAQVPLTVAKTLDLYTISDLRFEPQGKRLVFQVAEPVRGTVSATHLWIHDAAGARQLTHSGKSERSGRWAPDGKRLAFLSNREDGFQLYVLPLEAGVPGGEAQPLAKHKGGVNSFVWSPDGKRIAYLAAPPKPEAMEKREKEQDDARVVDDPARDAQLWVLDVAAGKAKSVDLGKWRIEEMDWSAQGLFAIATDQPHSGRWESQIVRVDVEGAKVVTIAKPVGPVGGLQVAQNGEWAAYRASPKDGPDAHDLWLVRLSDGTRRNLTGKTIDRPIQSAQWQADGALLVTVGDGVSSAVYRVPMEGKPVRVATKNLVSQYTSGAGVRAWIERSATQPMELWMESGGAPERVTKFHESWAAVALLKPEKFVYKSFDGRMMESLVLRPANANGKLVVLVHGGPTGAWTDSFEPWGQLLAAKGFTIFYPNIRGSVGYGSEFVESNRNDWGGGDFQDLMAGVDALIAKGWAKADGLGIGGWSYGGYMAAWAITQTTRFKAAVAGAGLSDLASEYGTEAGPAYDEWYFGTPYENLANFTKSSPITFIKNAKTPTLILQGESDTTDPIGQSQQLYRGLVRYGVPTEFVLYPREGHGIREEKHRMDLVQRFVGWFEKYL